MHVKKPTRKYKPLFNKTYLKYLGFIVAIAIIILSKKAAKPLEQPEPFNTQHPLTHVLKADNLTQHRLLLSFLTSPALTSRDKVERELSYQALRQQTKKSSQIYSVLWTFDRLEIELRWDNNQPIDIDRQLHTLIENSKYNMTQDERQLVAASHYLESKSSEALLLNTLENQLSRQYNTATPIDNILHNSPTVLLITDKDSDHDFITEIDQQLNRLFSSRVSVNTPSAAVTANGQRFEKVIYNNATSNYQQLIASDIKLQTNLQSQKDLLSHFILGNILSEQVNTFNARIIRKPIYQNGYQAIILSSNQNLPKNFHEVISQSITVALIDKYFYKVKSRLIDAYRELVDNRERLFALYSKKLFYGLETQSLSVYEEQLDSITQEQILEHIQYLLSKDNSIIYLQPNQ